MRSFATIALAAATASAVRLQQEGDTPSPTPVQNYYDKLYDAIYEDGYNLRGDTNNDYQLSREEFAASGMQEALGYSFDELNVDTEGYGGANSLRSYEIVGATDHLYV